MAEKIDIVNNQNIIIGKDTYNNAHNQSLRHRTIHILLFSDNSYTDLLICKRQKGLHSGQKFSTSAGGHVKTGETEEEASSRELFEELNINTPLKILTRYHNNTNPKNKEITTLFYGIIDKNIPILFNKTEVSDILWVNIDNIKTDIYTHHQYYTQSLSNAINHFKKAIKINIHCHRKYNNCKIYAEGHLKNSYDICKNCLEHGEYSNFVPC